MEEECNCVGTEEEVEEECNCVGTEEEVEEECLFVGGRGGGRVFIRCGFTWTAASPAIQTFEIGSVSSAERPAAPESAAPGCAPPTSR